MAVVRNTRATITDEKRGFALQKLGRDDEAAAAFKKAKEVAQ